MFMRFVLALGFGPIAFSSAHALSTLTDVTLNPRIEGVYSIHLECQTKDNCNPEILRDIDLVSVVDSHDEDYGVSVSFSSSDLGEPVGGFWEVQVGASSNQLSSDGSGSSGGGGGGGRGARFSYMDLNIDPNSGELQGDLQDVDALYKVVGKPLVRVGQLKGSPGEPPDMASLVGTYTGNIFAPGKLKIAMLPNHTLTASFATDSSTIGGQPDVTLHFSSVRWNAEIGALQMNFLNRRFFIEGELSLYVSGANELKGIYFTGPHYSNASFRMKKLA